MAELILHIGDGKCGSTAIQTSLYEARDDLLRKGVLYLPDDVSLSHFSYAALLGARIRGNTESAKKRAQENLLDIAAAFRKFAPDHVVFSAECFLPFGPEKVLDLIETTGIPVSGVHVVAYVRHPVSMFLSLNQQKIKASHVIYKAEDYERNLAPALQDWGRCRKLKSIFVNLFDRKSLFNGSIVQDFGRKIQEIASSAPVLAETTANESLSSEQMVILQKFRHDFLKEYDGKSHRNSSNLSRLFESINSSSKKFTRPQLNARTARAVMHKNQGHIEKLDLMFPEIGMARSYQVPDDSMAPEDERWGPDCIGALLERVDPDLVGCLMDLIPFYNTALRSGPNQRCYDALEKIGGDERTIDSYASYLSSYCGMDVRHRFATGACPDRVVQLRA